MPAAERSGKSPVEHQDDVAVAPEIRQPDQPALPVRQREIRRRRVQLDSACHSGPPVQIHKAGLSPSMVVESSIDRFGLLSNGAGQDVAEASALAKADRELLSLRMTSLRKGDFPSFPNSSLGTSIPDGRPIRWVGKRVS
jgi:hypothetical protein